MRRIDRWLLVVAYVALFGFVAWMSYDLDRRAQQTQEAVCEAAYIQVFSAITTQGAVTAIADEESLSEKEQNDLLDLTLAEFALLDPLKELCGEPPSDITDLDAP